jgi:hypothetical protein
MQQPSESQSDRLLPRFDALVKPAFLSITGSISAFIFAAYFYAGNSNVDFGWLVSLLYGNIGSVLLAYSIVALVTRVHRRLWGFFIVLYSILEGILGLFLVGYPYAYYAHPYGTPSAQNPYETLITIFALVAPIVGLIGGLLGAVWPISSGQAKVGTTQPTGAGLMVPGGILLSFLSLLLVFFVGPTVVVTFFAGVALFLLGMLRTPQLSSAETAIDPGPTPRPISSRLNLGRAEVFSLAGSLVPAAIIWTALVMPFLGNSFRSPILYVELGSPGQVLFAFAIAQFSDTDHRRFWGLTLAIASVLIGIGFFAVYTYPFFFVYSGLASQNGLFFGALFIAFFVAPILCFFGGLLAFLKGRRPGTARSGVNHSSTPIS